MVGSHQPLPKEKQHGIVFAGSNVIPSSVFRSNETPELERAMIRDAVAVTMNTIRVWGGETLHSHLTCCWAATESVMRFTHPPHVLLRAASAARGWHNPFDQSFCQYQAGLHCKFLADCGSTQAVTTRRTR